MSGSDIYDDNMAGSVDPNTVKTVSQNVGLYSGNVIIEFNTDQKVVKPVIKINEKADPTAILHAVSMAIIALRESTKALQAYEVTIPDPLKTMMVNTLEESEEEPDDSNITKIREKEDDLEKQLTEGDPLTEASKILGKDSEEFLNKRGEDQNS